MSYYRTYDPTWNRSGWDSKPQYPGQEAVENDYPIVCHCGAHMTKWNVGIGAACKNGHEMQVRPVMELVA